MATAAAIKWQEVSVISIGFMERRANVTCVWCTICGTRNIKAVGYCPLPEGEQYTFQEIGGCGHIQKINVEDLNREASEQSGCIKWEFRGEDTKSSEKGECDVCKIKKSADPVLSELEAELKKHKDKRQSAEKMFDRSKEMLKNPFFAEGPSGSELKSAVRDSPDLLANYDRIIQTLENRIALHKKPEEKKESPIAQAAQKPEAQNIKTSIDQVLDWLNSSGYGDLVNVFRDAAVDGTILANLTEDDLKEYVKETAKKERSSMFYKNFMTKRALLFAH